MLFKFTSGNCCLNSATIMAPHPHVIKCLILLCLSLSLLAIFFSQGFYGRGCIPNLSRCYLLKKQEFLYSYLWIKLFILTGRLRNSCFFFSDLGDRVLCSVGNGSTLFLDDFSHCRCLAVTEGAEVCRTWSWSCTEHHRPMNARSIAQVRISSQSAVWESVEKSLMGPIATVAAY